MERFMVGMNGKSRNVREVVLALLLNIVDHGLMEGFLVALQSQHVVRFAINDLLRNGLLSSHRIDRGYAAADSHEPQKLGYRRDFVRFLRAGYLPQRQAQLAGP